MADVNRVWPAYRLINRILDMLMYQISFLDHYVQNPEAENEKKDWSVAIPLGFHILDDKAGSDRKYSQRSLVHCING